MFHCSPHFLPRSSIELELNQKIQFSVCKLAFCQATVQEVAQKRVSLERLLDDQQVEQWALRVHQSMLLAFTNCPLKHLTLDGPRNREGKVGCSCLKPFGAEEL